MFPTVPLCIIRSFSLHTQQWYMSYRFSDSLLSENLYSGGFVPVIENSRNCVIFDRLANIKYTFPRMFTHLFRMKKIG